MQYSQAERLLAKIDKDNEAMFGPIIIGRHLDSNSYMWELDHRRWNHPEYNTYLKLREDEKRLKRIADNDKKIIFQR